MLFDIDKYLNQLPLTIKAKNQKFINIRCPICGDSSNNKYKARGYIMINSDIPTYNCFNECGGMSFYQFLKEQNEGLAKEFLKDTKLRNRRNDNIEVDKNKRDDLFGKTTIKDVLDNLSKEENPLNLSVVPFDKAYYTYTKDNEQITTTQELSPLSDDAKNYLYGRGFKDEDIQDFKFVEEFQDIVIPMWFNKSKNLVYGMQMRRLLEKRFHNAFLENPYKMSNLEYIMKLPKGSDVYLFEAEFDRISTTLENSTAIMGAKMSQEVQKLLKDYNCIQCGDADEEGYKKSLEMSQKGYHTLVHDEMMFQFKDFNKLLELGQSKEAITEYIKTHIKSPKRAYMELRRSTIKK